MAGDREAKVRLDVERGGEPEAFAEAAEEALSFEQALEGLRDAGVDVSGIEETDAAFQELNSRLDALLGDLGVASTEIEGIADGATAAAEGMGAGLDAAAEATKQLGSGAGESLPRVNSLKDAVKLLGTESNLTAAIVKGSFIAGLVTLSSEINGKLVGALNAVTQQLGAQTEQFRLAGGILPVWQGGIDGAAQALLRFQDGSAAVATNLEEQVKAHDKARAAFLAARQPILDAAANYKKLAAELLPTREQLQGNVLALEDFLQKVQAAGTIQPPQLKSLLEEEIRGLLAHLDKLPADMAARLQGIATSLGVLPASIQAAADESKARMQTLAQQLAEAMGLAPPLVKRHVDEILGAIRAFGGAQNLTPAARQVVQSWVQGLVDELRAGKQPMTAELQALADQFGVVITDFQRIGTVIVGEATEAAGAIQRIGDAWSNVGTGVSKAEGASKGFLETLNGIVDQSVAKVNGLASAVEVLATKAQLAASALNEVERGGDLSKGVMGETKTAPTGKPAPTPQLPPLGA